MNNQFSFVVVGTPRLGKTTTMKNHFNGIIVDTDKYSNPLEVTKEISANSCFIIGKYRNITIKTDIGNLSYKEFIIEHLKRKSIPVYVMTFLEKTGDSDITIQVKYDNISELQPYFKHLSDNTFKFVSDFEQITNTIKVEIGRV